jgi:2,4-dienoyl-CoA reductase-like NADH-dependent reductase (Old Yellow Enzyme family)
MYRQMYEKLFSEGKIGKVTFRNRLVMSPMGIGLAELDGTPGDEMIAYYAARAEGGAGLVIPEITRVNDVHGAGMLRQLSVSQDRNIEPLSRWRRPSTPRTAKSSSSCTIPAARACPRSSAASRSSPRPTSPAR